MERFCYLDDEDRRLIAVRRRSDTQLGFALQLVTVRNLGMFLADPLDVPVELVEYVAEQLGIDDPSCVKRYTERDKTRLEHAWEIQRRFEFVPFAEVQGELVGWIADQAWMTGEGPKAIFVGAIEWLRSRNALLPGITTLDALIAEGRAAAEKRLWEQLAARVAPGTSAALVGLLDIPQDAKYQVSELERLRKGAFRASWKGMVKALRRLEDIQAVGIGAVELSAVPPRRLAGLATYGLAGNAWALRRLKPREKQIAVLAATGKVMLARAVDDVLEVFDLLMASELLGKAERQSKEEKLARFPRISRNAGKLASAVKVLLEMVEVNQDVGLGVVWDMIEKTVTKSELHHAVAAIDELVPAGDAELDGQRLAELAGKLNTVKPFLPLMMQKVAFGATPDGAAVLAAMKTLAELLVARPTTKLPSNLLDARKVDLDLVGGAWSRLVYIPGRPEGTVDKAAYTMCVLEQFHRHLKHRSIFAAASGRWRDPRAHLLSGDKWESAREAGMNALNLPADPSGLLAKRAAEVDAAYRELMARLGEDSPARIDDEGKLFTQVS